MGDAMDIQEAANERFKFMDGEGVGPVAQGVGGIVVHLEEQAVRAAGDRRPGQRLDVFGLAAGGAPGAARELDGVGGVEHTGQPSRRMMARERKSTTRLL